MPKRRKGDYGRQSRHNRAEEKHEHSMWNDSAPLERLESDSETETEAPKMKMAHELRATISGSADSSSASTSGNDRTSSESQESTAHPKMSAPDTATALAEKSFCDLSSTDSNLDDSAGEESDPEAASFYVGSHPEIPQPAHPHPFKDSDTETDDDNHQPEPNLHVSDEVEAEAAKASCSQYKDCGTITDTCCNHCGAYKFLQERPGFCCLNGKVQLDNVPELPQVLQDLYGDPNYLKNIRSYNNELAMASIHCTNVKLSGFNPIIKIQGKVHHLIGPWQPEPGKQPKFAQIYFHDPEHETVHRSQGSVLKPQTVEMLQNFLRQNNKLVKELGVAIALAKEATADYNIVLVGNKNAPQTYDLPTSNEIAALVHGDQIGYLDVLMRRNGRLERINEMHQSYDPLHYVLLFPYGTSGYSRGEKGRNGKDVTVGQFYCYHLQLRKNSFNHLLRSARLSQQFACDMRAKVERYMLRWIVNNQKTIRADKYKGLMDAVANNDGQNAGRNIILPPTVYGCDRWYVEAFQDAMALVRAKGKPDTFVTFTCNPKWPEIQRSLSPGEKAVDRPDIYVRVFHIKLQELLKILISERILGEIAAYTSMKEDQKRGLPHAHILIINKKGSKFRCGDDVSKYISAEIPSDENSELFDIIKRNNIHGPCGKGINDRSPCIREGTCSKKFPKDFVDHPTRFSEDSKAILQRRSPQNGGKCFQLHMNNDKPFNVDNRWIVPYNPQLSLYFNAHINVEPVNSTKSVKYIYKYTYKGTDKATFMLKSEDGSRNEVENFLNGRYIVTPGALWRLFKFEIQNKWPSTMKLAVHLPQEQMVMFEPEDACALAAEGPPQTTLTGFFKLTAEDPRARKLRYVDVPRQYLWKGKQWVRRKARLAGVPRDSDDMSPMVGRIPVIGLTPRQRELYFLRILLHHIKGPRSYDELKIINGEKAPTFQDACIKLGLISDTEELNRVMTEAATCQFGAILRELFAFLLLYCNPLNPFKFFETHKTQLCEDLMRALGTENLAQSIVDRCLNEINETIADNGMDLTNDFGFPQFARTAEGSPIFLADETCYDIQALTAVHFNNFAKMTDEQRQGYNAVVKSALEDKGKCFRLEAEGGGGKTFLLTTILARLRRDGEIALATAISGIAAILLPNGRTLHSRCKVPIKITDTSTCNLTKRDGPGKLLMAAKLLVVDEVTMGHRYIFEALDRSLRLLRCDDRLFGGLTVLLSGDWRQILPVVPKGGRAEIIDATLKMSHIWEHTVPIKLSRNLRVSISDGQKAEEFRQFLINVGEDRIGVSQGPGHPKKVKIPNGMVLNDESLDSLQEFVFGSEFNTTDRCILAPLNEDVDAINDHILRKFPGELETRLSADTLCDSDEIDYPQEFLNKIKATNMPPHDLKLKIGCPVMLIRNLNPTKGHCNGTRYVINNLMNFVIDATITTGLFVGKSVLLPRIPFVTNDDTLPFTMSRVQYPVKPCFAVTFNKGQGQSLKRVGLYLRHQVFSHGQLYVGLSRATDPDGIKVLGQKDANGELFVDNVVYSEILDK